MNWLTLVPEDSAVQRLMADNRKPAITRALDPVSPYPSTHPARIGEHPETAHRRSANRQPGERRQGGDRRRKQVPVILDTRSKHDRRSLLGRPAARRAENTDTPRRRIDVFA
ncbi:MAG: hypothetical protein ACE5FQ_02045 [Thiogranum sp.]